MILSLWIHYFLRLPSQFFVFLCLLLQPFLFPLSDNELVSCDSLALQVNMQNDEVEQQKDENRVDRATDPSYNEAPQELREGLLGCENSQCDDKDEEMSKS